MSAQIGNECQSRYNAALPWSGLNLGPSTLIRMKTQCKAQTQKLYQSPDENLNNVHLLNEVSQTSLIRSGLSYNRFPRAKPSQVIV